MKALDAPGSSIDPMTVAKWRAWLRRHHDRGEGVWLVIGKKAAKGKRLRYDEAVEEALCWGWIDSRSRSLDDERTAIWMSPRGAKSAWSKSNKDRVEALLVPADLAEALEAAKGLANFNAFPPGSRRNVLAWIESAKKPGTRARRIAETARLAAMNIRVHDFITMARARRG